jgi:hypothetical protein
VTTSQHDGSSPRHGIPSPRQAVALVDPAILEKCLKQQPALCVICRHVSVTDPSDPAPERLLTQRAPNEDLPPVDLCAVHWELYRRDWLLLGWCVDHYGEALRYCPIHHAVIEPL